MDHLTATENLLTAIETVAKSVVDKVEYDKTLTCTVVDVSAAANGKYIVTDGSTKFAAYSENTSFKSGDVVYVTVPNGDMTEQKVILGRKTSDQTEPFNYKSPFDNLLICSPDLINASGEGVISSVQTNNDTIDNVYIGSITEEDCQKYKNFDRIGVKASFQTVLPAEKIETGDYGLKIDIGYIDTVETTDYEISWEDGYRADREYYYYKEDVYEEIVFSERLLYQPNKYYKKDEKNNYILSTDRQYNKNETYYKKGVFYQVKVSQCNEGDFVDYSNINYNYDKTKNYVYKPNFFYYKNYQLDNSLKPRQNIKYYIYKTNNTYEQVNIYDIDDVALVQIYADENKENLIEKNDWKQYRYKNTPVYCDYKNEDGTINTIQIYFYKPNTFYWVKDEDDDKQYILSTDNGWDSSNKYFMSIEPYKEIKLDETTYKKDRYFIKNDEENYVVSNDNYNPDITYYDYTFSSLILDKNNYKPGAYYVLKREEQTFVSTVYLNTKDMIGQPYNFVVPMNQEKVFDISNIQNIKQIDFYLYQDNNFITLSGEQYQANEDNIFLTNLEMYYGYDITDIDEEYLQIYTTDPLNYYQAYNSIEDICKKIKLKWVHVIDDESYVIDNDHLNYFSLSAAADIESAISNSENNGIASLLTLKDESDQYIYTLKLDNSPTYTENRIYLTRSIRFGENNSTQFLAKFIKNYNEEYNENREYYEKKYLKNSEVLGLSEDVIKTKGTFNLVTEFIQKGSAYNEEYKYYTQQGYHNNNIWKSFSVTPDMLDDNGLFVTDEYQGNKIYQQYYKAETGEYREYYCPKKNLDKNSISRLYYLDISIVEGSSSGDNISLQLEKVDNINQTNYEQGKYYYLEHKNEQNIDIRWYYYKEGAPAADQYSGVFWKRIPLWDEEEKPALGINYLSNLFELDFYPDPIYNKTEQIKVIAIYNNNPIYSNVLELTNDDPVINLPTIEQENALRMRFEDQTNGKYFIYDDSNHLIDKGNSQQIREITLLFDKDDFTSNSVLNNAESVKWIIPKNNTMINIADVNDGTKYEDDRFYYLEDIGKRQEYKLKYTIKNTYSFSNDNNTIVCNVFKDGTLYSCTQNLSFGQAGSNGSEYTLVLNLLSSDQVVTLKRKDQKVFYKTFEKIKAESINKAIENDLYVYREIQENDEIKNCYIQITLDEWDQVEQLYTQTLMTLTISSDKDEQNKSKDVTENYAKGLYYSINREPEENEDKYNTYYELCLSYIFDENGILKIETNENGKQYVTKIKDGVEEKELYEEDKDTKRYHYSLLDSDVPYPIDKVQAVLYDQNYNKVSIPDGATFKWEWVSSYNELENGFEDVDQTLFDKIEETNDIITLQIKPDCQEPFKQVCILKVTLQNFGDYDLISYLPIPIRSDYGPVRYQGPTQVIYSSYGAPNYYSNDIVLYYNDEEGNIKSYPEGVYDEFNNITGFEVFQASNEIKDKKFYQEHNQGQYVYDKENKKYIEYTEYQEKYEQNPDSIENYHYRILKESNENDEEKEIKKVIRYEKIDNPTHKKESSFIPQLLLKEEKINESEQETIKKHIVFKPSELFIDDIGMFAIQYRYNDIQIWSQPILYMQNRYFSSTLNKWDGSLKVDEENNAILAQSFAAGRKESDNSFSGLIMGDWSQKVNATESASGDFDITKSTGLYAFNHGATSFGLNDNGQMFLGKSGRGRIYFDGENATIGSADWYNSGNRVGESGTGLLLDIDDGFLISRNSKGQYIKIDSLASKDEKDQYIGFNDDTENNNLYYKPASDPSAGGTENEYPFVIYGDDNNYTAIGWRGNLLLHGTRPSDSNGDIEYDKETGKIIEQDGSISINASAKYLPINVNKHFGVGWNGALIISSSNIGNVISANYNDFGKGFKTGEKGDQGSSSESVVSNMQDSDTYFPSKILQVNDYKGLNWGTEITSIRADDNNYDYSELQSNFNGLYATPYGDLFLSRKLIIGDEFSVTGEGYLKASNALFDQCNANTFTLKYTPYFSSSQAQARNEFLRQYYGIISIKDNKKYSKVPTMGQLGYVTGANEQGETDNIGIRSLGNFGIKLSSNKNISITARTTENDLEEFKDWNRKTDDNGEFCLSSDYNDGGGIYLESQRFGLSAFKTITIGHTKPVKNDTIGLNRIQFLSEHELYERGNKILLQVNDVYQQNSTSETKGSDNENIEQANENQNLGFYSWSEGQNKESLMIEPNTIQLYLGGNSVKEPYEIDDNGTFVKKINGGYEVYDGGRYSVWGYPESEYEYNGNKLQRYKYVSRSSDGGIINDGTARILLGYPVLQDTNIIDHPFITKETGDKKKNRIEIYTINGGASYIDDGKEKPKIANLILLDHCKENGLMGNNEERDLIKIASQNEVLLIAGPKQINNDYNFNKNTGDNVGSNYFKLYNNNTGTADLVTTNSIFFSTDRNKITMKNAIDDKNIHPQIEILSSAKDTDKAVLTLEPSRSGDQDGFGGTAILEASREVKLVTRGNASNLSAAIYLVNNQIYFTAAADHQHGIYARFA